MAQPNYIEQIMGLYVQGYKIRDITLDTAQIAQASSAIQQQLHESIEDTLTASFDIMASVPPFVTKHRGHKHKGQVYEAPNKQEKIIARRIDNAVMNVSFFCDSPSSELTYVAAVATYFLHAGVEGLPEYPSLTPIAGHTRHGLGDACLKYLRTHLAEKGILKS